MAGTRTKIRIALVTTGLFLLGLISFFVWLAQQPVNFRMGSEIMAPTIALGEVNAADMAGLFQHISPHRWEVAVFVPPTNNTQRELEFWCLRVVGLPGESIDVRGDGIYIDGKRQDQPDNISHIRYAPTMKELASKITYPYKIPSDRYFLLGDNTTNSWDSRYWGCLSGTRIYGIVKGK